MRVTRINVVVQNYHSIFYAAAMSAWCYRFVVESDSETHTCRHNLNHKPKTEKEDHFNASAIKNETSQKAATTAWEQSLSLGGPKQTQTTRSAAIYYLYVTSACALSPGRLEGGL